MSALGNPKGSEKIFKNIVACYGKPNRFYHILEHIVSMLDKFETVSDQVKNPDAVRLTIWYHDIADSEEVSAHQAELDIKEMGLSDYLIKLVCCDLSNNGLIMATKHKSQPQDLDTMFLLDLDLAILGSAEKEFDVDDLKSELKDKFVIGAMSRIHPSKGIDVLIKALGELKDEDWVLILGGKDFGVLNEYLLLANKLGILDRIKYLGFINKTKEKFYKACDLFVSPSKAEALGMTLVEAQACGVPVIGSDFGAIRETMIKNVTGFNVPYGDYKLLAEKIRLLMNDDNLRKRFASNALKRGTQFSWKNIADCIEKVYNGDVVDFYAGIKK